MAEGEAELNEIAECTLSLDDIRVIKNSRTTSLKER